MAEAVEGSITVDADPDAVMEVIADFAAYPEWQAEVTSAEVLETDADGWGTRARFVIKAGPITTSVVLDYTYAEDALRWQLSSGEGLRRNDGEYTLRDLGDGRTEVHYRLELEPTVSVPGLIRRRVARGIVDGALGAMKRRVEAG